MGDNKFTMATVSTLAAFATAIIGLGIWAGKLDERTQTMTESLSGHVNKPAHFAANRRYGELLVRLDAVNERLKRIERILDTTNHKAIQ